MRNKFDKAISTSEKGELETQRWINNIESSCCHIVVTNTGIAIHADASLTVITDHNTPSTGLCHKSELDNINVFELKAIEVGIQTYCEKKTYAHGRIMCDDITAMTY